MKYIITVPEDSVLPDVLELLAEQGVIELEEVVEQKRHKGIGIIAVDVITGEQLEFNSIQHASEELGISNLTIKRYLDTKEVVGGYCFRRQCQKHVKLK